MRLFVALTSTNFPTAALRLTWFSGYCWVASVLELLIKDRGVPCVPTSAAHWLFLAPQPGVLLKIPNFVENNSKQASHGDISNFKNVSHSDIGSFKNDEANMTVKALVFRIDTG